MRTVHESNGAKGTMVKLSSTSLFAFDARIGSATSAQYSSRKNVAMCLNSTSATRSGRLHLGENLRGLNTWSEVHLLSFGKNAAYLSDNPYNAIGYRNILKTLSCICNRAVN